MIGGSSPDRDWEFFSSPPRPDQLWRPTQPPIQWVPEALSLGVKRPGSVKLTTHLHLVPRSKMLSAVPPLPNTPSWRGAQLKHRDYITFTLNRKSCNCWWRHFRSGLSVRNLSVSRSWRSVRTPWAPITSSQVLLTHFYLLVFVALK
jgi:hypothetical protein